MQIIKCALGYMLLIVQIPLILIRESLLIIWKCILQINLMKRWFQILFILVLCLNFGTKRQRKLKLILSLLILANWFPWLDTGHQDILFHACVQFWKISDCWGCYEIVFLSILEQFHENTCTVRYQTHMSECLVLWMVLHRSLNPLTDLIFFTALSWWISTRFTCRFGYPRFY